MALSEAISQAFTESATPEVTPTDTAATAVETTPATATEIPEGQGLIGVPEQPAEAGTYKLFEGVQSDAVVMTGPNGEEIKASDLIGGFMRQSDYTKKTQELAQYAKELPAFVQSMIEHEQHFTTAAPLINALIAGDQQALQGALTQLAQDSGIQLERQRDERGRFTSSKEEDLQEEDLQELLAKGYTPEDEEYQRAAKNNVLIGQLKAQRDQLKAQDAKLNQFVGTVQSEQAKQATIAKLERQAGEWAALGLQGIDLEGAEKLVGKEITPEMAMKLHHFDKIMLHNINHQKKQQPAPNTPAALGAQPTVDPAGMSWDAFARQSFGR